MTKLYSTICTFADLFLFRPIPMEVSHPGLGLRDSLVQVNYSYIKNHRGFCPHKKAKKITRTIGFVPRASAGELSALLGGSNQKTKEIIILGPNLLDQGFDSFFKPDFQAALNNFYLAVKKDDFKSANINKKFSTTDLLSGLLISYIYIILCINEKDKIKLTTFVALLEKEAKSAKKSLAADVLFTDAIGVVVSWDKILKIVLDDLGIIDTYLSRAKKLGGFKESISSIRKLLQTGTKNSDFIANDVHPLDVLTPAVLESSLAQLSNLTEIELLAIKIAPLVSWSLCVCVFS